MPTRGDGLALLEYQVLLAEGETECAEFSEKIALTYRDYVKNRQTWPLWLAVAGLRLLLIL